jgi:dihydroxyacetone kinase-like protein
LSKKFINDPLDVVEEMLEGFLLTHQAMVRRLDTARVVVTATPRAHGTRVIAGGGSGHEPALLGYVGTGLLDAVVVGDVVASPPAPAVLEAIRATDTGEGVLILIGNYAGDVMNFEMAAEWARDQGHEVAIVVIADDAAPEDLRDLRSRRGLAGSVLVWKVAGAAAAAGNSLDEVRRAAESAAERVRTVAVAHGPGTIPGSDHPAFVVADGEYQFGVGHGEPGISSRTMAPTDVVVDAMLDRLLAEGFLREPGARAITMVNGLGAVPLMELYIIQRHLLAELEREGIAVHRGFVGQFYTAFETAGFSISLLEVDEELGRLIDAPARAPHFVQLEDRTS